VKTITGSMLNEKTNIINIRRFVNRKNIFKGLLTTMERKKETVKSTLTKNDGLTRGIINLVEISLQYSI